MGRELPSGKKDLCGRKKKCWRGSAIRGKKTVDVLGSVVGEKTVFKKKSGAYK